MARLIQRELESNPMATKEAHCSRRTQGSRTFTQSPPNARIAHTYPRPGRRRAPIPLPTASLLFSAFLLLSLMCTPTLASGPAAVLPRRVEIEARINDIIFDPRPLPKPHLERRQFDLESTTTSKKESKTASEAQSAEATSTSSAATTDSSDSSTSTGIDSAPLPSGSVLPKAFDGGLGTNYTQPGCLDFLNKMISNDTFSSCLPFSLLLQNSMSFFSASRSSSTLDPVLSASCNIVFPACSSLMASYALGLRSSTACSQDYDRQNPTVRQAYNGLISYDVLYRTGCLKASPTPFNNQSSDYCYTNAVTNTTSPTDSYVYYLALGVDLPAGSMPTCSQCLKDTMAQFATAAGNKTQPLSLTYVNAASLINVQCGPNWVNASLPKASGGSSSIAATSVPSLNGVAFAMMLAFGIVHLFGLM